MALNPGPGSYETQQQKLRAPGLGKSQRFVRKDNGIPGPGQYKQLHTVGNVPDFAHKRNDETKYV